MSLIRRIEILGLSWMVLACIGSPAVWAFEETKTASLSSTQPTQKNVASFPDKVDLSTPESAWAAYHRATARMDAKSLVDLSGIKIDPGQEEDFWKREKTDNPDGLSLYNKALMEAKIIDVLMYKGKLAGVVSWLPFPDGKGKNPYSLRVFGDIQGRWKNLGELRFSDLPGTRAEFNKNRESLWTCFMEIRSCWVGAEAGENLTKNGSEVASYRVGKPISAFAQDLDLSTPENACVMFNRATANREANAVVDLSWIKVDPDREAQFWKRQQRDDPAGLAADHQALLNAKIFKVFVYRSRLAGVLSFLPFPAGKGEKPYRLRWFGLINEKWKNLGEDSGTTMDQVKEAFNTRKDRMWDQFDKISLAQSPERSDLQGTGKKDLPTSIFQMEVPEKTAKPETAKNKGKKSNEENADFSADKTRPGLRHSTRENIDEPSLIVKSTTGSDGRTIDRTDYPFVEDPKVLGRWVSVDLVQNIEAFKPEQKKWNGDLFLKDLDFKDNGRIANTAFRWTKGLVLNHGDHTAGRYILKNINGSTYMFFEWKSGDYTIRHTKPMFYVLKKVSSEVSKKDQAMDAGEDLNFRRLALKKIPKLDISRATLNDVIQLFGKPVAYAWGRETFEEANLPSRFILKYPDRFQIYMKKDKIVELRYHNPGYKYNSIEVGSSLEQVLQELGPPAQTVTGLKNELKDGILYKDIDGRTGTHYYGRKEKGIRVFFIRNKVKALHVTSRNF